MRAPGDILLVACYEMGHQPLALAWPAAFLERVGYRPAALDLSVDPLDGAAVRRARLVAISVPMHTALRLGARVAAEVRALNPGCHVCFYGLYATLNAGYLLANGGDSVLAGECEDDLVALARRLESETAETADGWRGAPLREASRGTPHRAGVASRAGRPPRQDPSAGSVGGDATARATLAKLSFPTPARAGLPPLERYAHLERGGQRELAGYVEASRGCLHRCRHCPIPPVYDGRFFVVPVDVVLADVRQQAQAGAVHMTFGDPDFLNGPGHALAVARAVHREFPALTFDFTAKIEHLLRHARHLPELGRLGCAFVVTAAESLDDAVLGYLDKGHTRADIERVLDVTRAAGIALRPTWIAFTPWTTLDGYRAWLDFVAARDLVDAVDPVQYAVRLLLPPGSLLLEHPALQPHLGPLDAAGFHYRWTHPDPRMERLHAEVTAAVGATTRQPEDPALTFERVRALADAAAGAAPR
ncbi:MAG: CUAEP/CCAEP-tail radical SAM (seleno)protein, partial [Candidatus Rokuibacteriota bacterium]